MLHTSMLNSIYSKFISTAWQRGKPTSEEHGCRHQATSIGYHLHHESSGASLFKVLPIYGLRWDRACTTHLAPNVRPWRLTIARVFSGWAVMLSLEITYPRRSRVSFQIDICSHVESTQLPGRLQTLGRDARHALPLILRIWWCHLGINHSIFSKKG